MKNLFQPDAVDELISRIDKLQPATQRQWGKMDVAQMMAHCSAALDLASGRLVRPRILIGRLIGPLARPIYSNDKPFSRNGPTDKKLVISDPRDFNREQEQLKVRIRQFHQGGEAQLHKASASLLWRTYAATVEHRNVQTPGPSPASIWSVRNSQS